MRAGWRALAFLFACLLAEPASGLTVLNRGNGAEIKSLDPHFIDGLNESNVEGDLLIGLLTMDPAGRPIPGAATSWTTSPDGRESFHGEGLRPKLTGMDHRA